LQTVIAVSYFLLQSEGQEEEAGGAVGTQAVRVANPRNAVVLAKDLLRERRYKLRGLSRFARVSRGIAVSHPPINPSRVNWSLP